MDAAGAAAGVRAAGGVGACAQMAQGSKPIKRAGTTKIFTMNGLLSDLVRRIIAS